MNGPCSACGDGDTALKYHSHDVRDPRITVEQGRFSAERLYTLAELETLAKEWRDENEATVDAQWTVSHLFAWLKKREREVEE